MTETPQPQPRRRSAAEMMQQVQEMAMEAGENGIPLLELGLMILVRASKHPHTVKAMLASIGTMHMLVLDDCLTVQQKRRRRQDD